jgi:hypothetical protein
MTTRTRTASAVVSVVAVVLLAGVTSACSGASHPSAEARALPPPRDLGTRDITKYISLPGNEVVTVPDGTYTGGSVIAPHTGTGGPYHGWLVLVAQSRGGVVVDLSTTHLTLEAGTSRVLFVGFKFEDGTVTVRGDDITFWYTEHTFPIEDWHDQYEAAGGTPDALLTMENALPKAIWIGEQTSRTVKGTQLLGADVHDVGDDGVFVDHSEGAVIQGTRIWNIDRKSYDPGVNPWLHQYSDLFHNDAVQIPGNVHDFTLVDSSIGTTASIGGDNATSTKLTFKNLWIADSFGLGFIFGVSHNNKVTGSMQDIRGWGNGTTHPNDPGWDQIRVDINEHSQATWPASLHDSRIQISSLGTNLNQAPPPGVTMSGRTMTDPQQALDSSLNPANVWRSAHPYTSWWSYFHFPPLDRSRAS